MGYILCFLIIILIATAISDILKQKIDNTIPITVILITLIIYPFGFFHKLDVGVLCVCIISIVSGLYFIYKFIKSIKDNKTKEFIKKICTPGLFIYAIFWAIFIYINRTRVFSSWDEFSHWGLIVKNMFLYNSYGSNMDTIVIFRGYPPFTAIFEYFFVKMKGIYIEGSIIVALNVLYISLILPLFNKIEWKKNLINVIIYIPFIFLLPLCLYKDFYTTIYVDTILGIMMAYILYCYFTIKDEKTKYLSVSLGLLALPLIKAAGTAIAIFTLLVILVDMLYLRNKNKANKKLIKKYIIIFIILILCIIIGKYSWDIHLKINNVKPVWNSSKINLQGIILLLLGKSENYRYTVIKNFIKQFFISPLNINIGNITNLSLLLIYVIYSIYSIYFIKKEEEDPTTYKRYKISYFVLGIFYIIYMLSLLILYIFNFSEYEAVHLASYPRYSFIFLLGMYAFNTLTILHYLKLKKTNKQDILILLVILVICFPFYTVKDLTVGKNLSVQQSIDYRKEFKDINKYNSLYKPEKNKIYYISCASKGMDFHVTRYEAIPMRISVADKYGTGWSLGEARYEGDVWTLNIQEEEWEKILIDENFNYVYVYKADDIFKNMYGNLFKEKEHIKDKTMYEVNIINNEVVLSEVMV